jgi:hypothetical protein
MLLATHFSNRLLSGKKLSKMNIQKILLPLFLAHLCPLSYGQEGEKNSGGLSSVQWANGSGIPGIELTLNGKLITSNWFAGANGGAGPKETTKWSVSFKPSLPSVGFSQSFETQNRSSSAAVLIGDFRAFTLDEMLSRFPDASEITPPGFTNLGPKGFTRATLLRFPIQKDADKKYPVYMVNGIPDTDIKITFHGGKTSNLIYAKPEIFNLEVAVRTEIMIDLDSRKELASMKLVPLHRGGILVFYRKQSQQQYEKLFVKLDSMESIEFRATNPKIEESQAEPAE